MKHIIWDFNGTLLNDAQLSVDTDNYVFDELGLPRITIDDYRRHMTMPVCDFYTALGVDLSVYPYETISRLWLDAFNRQAVSVGLVPGAMAAIERLKKMGFTQSVLSASYEVSLMEQCEALGLVPYMAAIDGREDECAGKKTEIGLRQMEKLGLDRTKTILVGDMVADAELAHALGVGCALVAWGHNDTGRLLNTGFPVAGTFDELIGILAGRK